MTQHDELDMDLMDAIFGPGSMQPESYLKTNEELSGEAVPNADEESRAAEFEQMVAKADVAAIENNTLAWYGRFRRGQFHSAAKRYFSAAAADLAYEAYFCDARMARSNDLMWQSLKQLQATEPALYQIVIGNIAWRRGGVEDRGPFGNDWGE